MNIFNLNKLVAEKKTKTSKMVS